MERSNTVKVWDPVVRVFHWTLVAAFAVAYLSEGEPEWLHTNAGYLIVILLGLRLVWGLVGTRHARFSDFVRSPAAAARYLVDELLGRARRYLGHNPAGGWMVIALMVSLLGNTVSGMALYAAEEGAGPLAGVIATASPQAEGPAAPARVVAVSEEREYESEGEEESGELYEEVHEFFANFTLVLVLLHVAGVILGSFRHRENLVASMWHGHKRPLDSESP